MVLSYFPVFLKVESEYEKCLINALGKLPCTSYVFPLENSLVMILHYDPLDSVKSILRSFEKLEENAIVDSFLLYAPIVYTK